nr:MAG TPA: DNA polymerase III [Caudoviricetes sp.]
MIGQKNNINTLIKWRCNKSVPRFIIISGDIGSGRLTFAKVIIKMINAKGIIMGNSIAEVRETIENAYTITEPTCYIFRNADDMRTEAKNALLKVVEEPPNNAYFIMTVENIDNMLGTIKSRGTVISMEPYSQKELRSVCDDDFILQYATNIADTKRERAELERTEHCVLDVIAGLKAKSGTKILKATTQLRSKVTETDKIDCILFMLMFKSELLYHPELYTPNSLKYLVKCTQELQRSSINKKASIECMLVSLLDEVKNEDN